VFLPESYSGILKGGRGSRFEKFRYRDLGAEPPAAGGYGDLGAKPPAAKENLQFGGQNIVGFCVFLD